MAKRPSPRPRYPQRCKICGHSWLAFTWAGPKQCPNSRCTSRRWRLGPIYLTENRRAQGWKRPRLQRGRALEEMRLMETALYEGPIAVEPLGEVREGGEGVGESEGARQDAREGPQEALGGAQEEGAEGDGHQDA